MASLALPIAPVTTLLILTSIRDGRQIQSNIVEIKLTHQNKIEALAAGDKLLEIHRRFKVSWPSQGSLLMEHPETRKIS